MSPIVQYDLTSSKDVKDLDQTYVYSSSKLSPLSASEFLFEPPAEEDQSEHSEQNSVLVLESDSASDEAGPSTSASKRTHLSGNASSDLKTLLITQPLLPRFMSSCHPNPKSKTMNLADYLFCQTVRQATLKSSQAH